jgi:mono/diheme cytochrome c family protein
MPTRQPKQSRNLTAALGDAPSQLTVYGVWLTGILIGAALILVIVLPGTLSNARVLPADKASADFSDALMINSTEYSQLAREGRTAFNLKCQGCHAQSGTASTGQGPRLDRSSNARDAAYIHTVVRQGVYGNQNPTGGMPHFYKTDAEDKRDTPYVISDDELYKVIVYLRSVQQYPRGPKPVLATTN